MFPPGRRAILPGDVDHELHIRLVYYIINKFPEFGADVVLSHIMGFTASSTLQASSPGMPSSLSLDEDSFHSMSPSLFTMQSPAANSSSISLSLVSGATDSMAPFERYVVALGAFRYFMADIQTVFGSNQGGSTPSNFGNASVVVESKFTLLQPPFPHFTDTTLFTMCEIRPASKADSDHSMIITPNFYSKLSSSTRQILDRVNEVMGMVGSSLEAYFSKLALMETLFLSQAPSLGTPNAGSSRRSSFSDPASSLLSNSASDLRQVPDRVVNLELMKVWLDLIPICSPVGMSPRAILVLISKQVFCGRESVRESAICALERISLIGNDKSEFWNLDRWNQAVIDVAMETWLGIVSDNMVFLNNCGLICLG